MTSDRPAPGDRLVAAVAERRSQIVLGLDPHPARLWPRAIEMAGRHESGTQSDPRAVAGRAVAAHCRLALEAAGGECVAVKPQVACFERLGAPGWAALAEVVADARERGLVVIADAKRGDIDVSARAYGEAFFGGVGDSPFGPLPGLDVDWLTASPLLGRDSLTALLEVARASGAGLFSLVRTSNPGAADLQDRALADGGAVSDAIAGIVDELGRVGIGAGEGVSGLSDVGAVVGATAPEHLMRLREAMPSAAMLLPGVGAQGASGEGLQAAFAPGPAGGLIASSRGIVDAGREAGGDPSGAAREAASHLRELVWGLYG